MTDVLGYEGWNENKLLETNQFSTVPPCSATLTCHKLEDTDLLLGVRSGMPPGPRQFVEI